jgi:hypothetical protein
MNPPHIPFRGTFIAGHVLETPASMTTGVAQFHWVMRIMPAPIAKHRQTVVPYVQRFAAIPPSGGVQAAPIIGSVAGQKSLLPPPAAPPLPAEVPPDPVVVPEPPVPRTPPAPVVVGVPPLPVVAEEPPWPVPVELPPTPLPVDDPPNPALASFSEPPALPDPLLSFPPQFAAANDVTIKAPSHKPFGRLIRAILSMALL